MSVAAFIFGYLGALEMLTEKYPHLDESFSDAAYISLKDFVLENNEP